MKKSRIRELYEQYEGALEDWQIKLAIARIRHFRIPPDAWEDTMQELAILVHRFQFDPAKAHAASEETILCRRMDNRIRMLARKQVRREQRIKRLAEMRHTIEDDSRPEDPAIHEEVRDIVRRLPAHLQATCRALMNGESAYQIAQRTGLHYESVMRHIRDIRQTFIDEGGDEWLG